ncbi:MAG: D-alanyl-D-alanine carboxypeptidase family protein [Candidatus Levyibacteriota bacterium]
MKKFFGYFFGILTLTLLLSGSALWYLYGAELHKSFSALSPVPDFLMLSKNNQATLLDLWFPGVQTVHGNGDVSDLTAQSVLMYDLTTDKILYEKDPKQRRPMASLTKIMTATIAIENKKPDDKYLVTKDDIVGEDSMGVSSGEILSFDDLIHGLLLPSGNDAAEVFAHNFPTGRNGFVQAMNNKAQALGLKDTHFTNPSGLQGDGNQYTTTYDLLVMTRYALEQYPDFSNTVATATYDIAASNNHKEFNLVNETNLLTTYPGVKGVKTGYTPEAGLCLVTYLDFEGHRIIGIILNSQNRRGEMKELLDYSLQTVGVTPPPYQDN